MSGRSNPSQVGQNERTKKNSSNEFQSGCGRPSDVIVRCGLPFDWPCVDFSVRGSHRLVLVAFANCFCIECLVP